MTSQSARWCWTTTRKYPTLYATGVDFTMAFDAPWYKMTSLRDSGSLLPLEDLIDKYGPVTKQHVGEKVYYFNFGPDDHLYGIPAGGAYGSTIGVVLREDLRLKYGAPEPDGNVGIASLEPFLQAIHDNEPDMIPLAVTSGATDYSVGGLLLQTCHKWLASGSGACPGILIPDVLADTKYDDDETVQEWRDGASLCHDWWTKGLINKEDLTGNTVTVRQVCDPRLPFGTHRGGAPALHDPRHHESSHRPVGRLT